MTSLFLGVKPERASLTLTLWSHGKPIQFQPLTMVMGWLLNLLIVNVFGFSTFVGTIVAAVAVVIGNYVISKLLVFRKK